ncbi:hypothetical protein D9619_000426 [Psilocybe cf. subviscida]|uniref:Uncharacterized protein n=1 Tax=Psilocybe cf. subviscida TaxID=2480587 RepID=A0A8H5BG29_9AGAR|nr:hypothetical protein D9619_000426 [Psilocybe cf. subviscida]
MSQYYPSHAGYASTQPVAYGHGQPYGMSQGYAPSGGVMMQPHMVQPQMVQSVGVPVTAPVMMQPGYNGYGRPYYTWGQRFRRFFGLAPANGVRYKRDHTTWGFMGYSRRQRYTDPRTGGEVDRKGRPVYRI